MTAKAWNFGLTPGCAPDLTVVGDDGEVVDLSDDKNIKEAEALIDYYKPLWLIGSPPCTYGAKFQAVNFPKMDPERVRRTIEESHKHLRTSIRFYRKQMDEDRYFLHEHPDGNRSWQEPEMTKLTDDERVDTVTSPTCRFDMTEEDQEGRVGLVCKRGKFYTKTQVMAEEMRGECGNEVYSGSGEGEPHEHVWLVGGGRQKRAQVYPPKMVRTIFRGIRKQMKQDNEISELQIGPSCEEPVIDVSEDLEEEMEQYVDDVNGGYLDPEAVRAGRLEEVEYFRKNEVYVKVLISTAWEVTGRGPITTRWVKV